VGHHPIQRAQTLRDASSRATKAFYPALSMCDMIFSGVFERYPTLTLAIGVWPRAYVLQVGDSRCYGYESGALRRLTRDQTAAQELVDIGELTPDQAARSPLQHVLTGAIGGRSAEPVVTAVSLQRQAVFLLCSDGLTRHVSDAELAERLGGLRSSEQVCRDLLQLALARGGHDNITIVVGRARRS